MSQSLFVFARKNRLFVRLLCGFVALFLVLSWLSPLMSGKASATGQITQRSVTLGSGVPSGSTSYTFTFTTATSAFHLDAIKLIACTTAIGSYPGGTCTKPTGFSFASATYGSISGFTDTTAFTIDTAGANDCVATAHPEVLCLKRTSSSNDTAGAKTLVINAVTNPSTANSSFYLGITTYNANTWPSAGREDAGTVAAAVVQTLTVNAQVAEVLNFCVGSTSVDDATTSVGANCAAISGTSVNLGVLDPSKINVTPVSTNCSAADCGKNGVAMVRSNALNGTIVYYDSIQQSGSNHKGTLRIAGQNCNATSNNNSSDTTDNTDQCFNVRTTQAAFSTSLERFGMTVAGVNCANAAAYTCTFSTGAYNLVRDAAYDGDGTNTYNGTGNSTDVDQINGPTTNGYAWDESGTAVPIASSASSTVKQIDDEALILKFAAHPLITTPFGSYTAQADFIAVSTY